MGTTLIVVEGSFTHPRKQLFSAEHGGHAEAVAEAIAWLSGDVLPEAIAQDHKLHGQGFCPSAGFGVTCVQIKEK